MAAEEVRNWNPRVFLFEIFKAANEAECKVVLTTS